MPVSRQRRRMPRARASASGTATRRRPSPSLRSAGARRTSWRSRNGSRRCTTVSREATKPVGWQVKKRQSHEPCRGRGTGSAAQGIQGALSTSSPARERKRERRARREKMRRRSLWSRAKSRRGENSAPVLTLPLQAPEFPSAAAPSSLHWARGGASSARARPLP